MMILRGAMIYDPHNRAWKYDLTKGVREFTSNHSFQIYRIHFSSDIRGFGACSDGYVTRHSQGSRRVENVMNF